MKTDYNNGDELLYSLPDYAAGEELEPGMKEKIEVRLKSDRSFYSEYMKIKGTFEFMKGVETDAAPDNYFSSLLPKIHERIGAKRERYGIMRYLAGSWKIAVPALSVILLIVIFTKSDRIEHIKVVPEFRNETHVIPADSNIKEQAEVTRNGVTRNEVTPEKEEKKETPAPQVKQKNVRTETTVNTEILGESLYGESEEEDELYFEDDFQNMNASEQNELINNLKNAKF